MPNVVQTTKTARKRGTTKTASPKKAITKKNKESEKMAMASASTKKKKAAFFDLDGTLCSSNIVHAYSYYARTQKSVFSSVTKLSGLVASIPFFLVADAYSRKVFNEIFYRRYKGENEDRLQLLGDELFEEFIKPTIYKQSYALLKQAKDAGFELVLVTGALDLLAKPVTEHLGMHDFVANKLEVENGYCTGRIEEPLLAGATKATWMRRYAKENNIDLEKSLAYTDSMSDLPMLSVVGHPSVINPDRKLKLQAKAFHWPVLYFK